MKRITLALCLALVGCAHVSASSPPASKPPVAWIVQPPAGGPELVRVCGCVAYSELKDAPSIGYDYVCDCRVQDNKVQMMNFCTQALEPHQKEYDQ